MRYSHVDIIMLSFLRNLLRKYCYEIWTLRACEFWRYMYVYSPLAIDSLIQINIIIFQLNSYKYFISLLDDYCTIYIQAIRYDLICLGYSPLNMWYAFWNMFKLEHSKYINPFTYTYYNIPPPQKEYFIYKSVEQNYKNKCICF